MASTRQHDLQQIVHTDQGSICALRHQNHVMSCVRTDLSLSLLAVLSHRIGAEQAVGVGEDVVEAGRPEAPLDGKGGSR